MTLAILYKTGRFEIYDDVYELNVGNNELTFKSSKQPAVLARGCFFKPLDEISKVSVNGIIYYEDGKVKL